MRPPRFWTAIFVQKMRFFLPQSALTHYTVTISTYLLQVIPGEGASDVSDAYQDAWVVNYGHGEQFIVFWYWLAPLYAFNFSPRRCEC